MDLQTQTCDVLAAGSGAGGFAAAQKSGNTLHAVVSTNQPSASIHEELTICGGDALYGCLQQSRAVQPGKASQQHDGRAELAAAALLAACRTGARVTPRNTNRKVGPTASQPRSERTQ